MIGNGVYPCPRNSWNLKHFILFNFLEVLVSVYYFEHIPFVSLVKKVIVGGKWNVFDA